MKLQFTNGYRPRFDQISRLLNYLSEQYEQPKISRQEIIKSLGMPDKQIENLTSMMVGFGLVKPRSNTITDFGHLLVSYDPYFDKPESLWLIHYLVSSNPEWVVWHRIITSVMHKQEEYQIEQISREQFTDLENKYSQKTYTNKLPKEVGAVFASYTRTKFAKLGLLQEIRTGAFARSEPIGVPPLVFLFCLVTFRDLVYLSSSATNVSDIANAVGSPGNVLFLQEEDTRALLAELHTNGLVRLEQVANLDQVRLPNTIDQISILKSIFES